MRMIFSLMHSRCYGRLLLLLCSLFVPPSSDCFGQAQNEAAILQGQGAFLRGAGSFNLNTANADSIDTDTLIRWKQDLRRIDAERRVLREQNEIAKKEKLANVKIRIATRERELRIHPTAADIQNGQALNALLYDLTDPAISSRDWDSKAVPLPKGMSVKDLIFRFIPVSGSSNASTVLSRGAIALSRLDVKGDKWPTAMKHAAVDKERLAYELAYAKLRDELLGDKFELKTLLAAGSIVGYAESQGGDGDSQGPWFS